MKKLWIKLKNGIITGLGFGLGLGLSYAFAVTVGTLNTFSFGATVSSSEINANFTTLKTAIESLNTEVQTIKSDVTTNSSSISTNTTNISTNTTNITTNTTNIATNTAKIGDWIAYTPQVDNLTIGNGNIKFFWRRNGPNMEIKGSIKWGTTTGASGIFLFYLPTGAVIDLTKTAGTNSPTYHLYERIGQATAFDHGPQEYCTIYYVTVQGNTTFRIEGTDENLTVGNPFKNDYPFTFSGTGDGDEILIWGVSVPIATWP